MKHLNEKGQALVELALSIMLLITIVFGIFEFGRAMYITNALNNMARDGARRAVVSGSTPLNVSSLKDAIKSSTSLTAGELAVLEIDISPESPSVGTAVTVSTRLPFTPVTPLIGAFFPSGSKLKGQASMRYE